MGTTKYVVGYAVVVAVFASLPGCPPPYWVELLCPSTMPIDQALIPETTVFNAYGEDITATAQHEWEIIRRCCCTVCDDQFTITGADTAEPIILLHATSHYDVQVTVENSAIGTCRIRGIDDP